MKKVQQLHIKMNNTKRIMYLGVDGAKVYQERRMFGFIATTEFYA